MKRADELAIIAANGGRCPCDCVPEMVERFGDKAHGPPCRGGGGLCWSCKYVRRCDRWHVVVDWDDESTMPNREGRAEMYRGSADPDGRMRGVRVAGALRSTPNPNDPSRSMWAVYGEVATMLDEFPDDLPIPEVEYGREWAIWRYMHV